MSHTNIKIIDVVAQIRSRHFIKT